MNPSDLTPWLLDPRRPPLVMGVLNITPDSFSDGGKFAAVDAALARAQEMVAQGADWIDIGAESTRPGSQRVGAAEQLARLRPVLRELRRQVPAVLSIDTTLAPVAEVALDAGLNIVNDISAGRDDPAMMPLVARRRVPIVLMHMQGEPATMQVAPHYSDVTAEVSRFLGERLSAGESAGILRENVVLDPGIGFGKTVAHNLRLLGDLSVLASLGRPMVVGASRKGFIGRVTHETPESGCRYGTAAVTAWATANGAAVVRVHDVDDTVRVTRMIRAIQTA